MYQVFHSLPLFLPLLFLLPAPTAAQLEVNPYVGILNEANEYIDRSVDNAATVYANDRKYALGADALFGAGRVAPLAGILFIHRRYAAAGTGDFTDDRLLIPLGAAYRLRHPATSFNILLSAAAVPGFSLSGDDTPISEARDGISWGLRGGAVLTFDFITAGVYYYRDLGDAPLGQSPKGSLIFALGGRF